LRHGEAEYSAYSDFDRPLTEAGERQVESVLRARKAELLDCDHLIASPLVRAQQSKHIVQALLPDASVITASWLKPSTEPQVAIDQLYDLHEDAKWRKAVLVSHLPFVADLIEAFCQLPSGTVRMGTGTLVAVGLSTVASGCGELLWQENPVV